MRTSRRMFFSYILCAALVFALSVILCFATAQAVKTTYAEELPQEETEVIQEEPDPSNDAGTPEDSVPDIPENSESDGLSNYVPTLFSRILEWAEANVSEILTVVGDFILVVCLIAQKIKQKKKLAAIGADILSVKDGVANTETSQKDVVNVTNELIEGYNRFEKALNDFDATEQERYRTMLAAFVQTKAILEIMTTVYANSKNIPQGVKDLVNLKYADVLKLVGDDTKLKEIAEPTQTEVCTEVSNMPKE